MQAVGWAFVAPKLNGLSTLNTAWSFRLIGFIKNSNLLKTSVMFDWCIAISSLLVLIKVPHDIKIILWKKDNKITELSKNLTLLAIQTLRWSISVIPPLSDLRMDAHRNIFLSFIEIRRDCIWGNGIRVRSLSSWKELSLFQYVSQ